MRILTVGGGLGDDGRTGEGRSPGGAPTSRRVRPRSPDDPPVAAPHGAEILRVAERDLRSHLATARGYLELLHRRWDDVHEEDRERFVARAAGQLSQLNDLLDDLLEFATWEAGHEASQAVTFDLAPLADEVTAGFDRAYPERRISLRIGSGPTRINADPRHVEHVLSNLLSNAVRYSPSGSPVDVGLRREAGQVLFAVRDRGRGISEEDQRRLFTRFHGVGDEGEGGGLGLYVCRRLVEAHGGRIWVDSEPEVGSIFTVGFPSA